MSKIGYIRVSTVEQNTERQLSHLTLDKLFEEKVSAKTTNRPKLQELLNYIREGDEIYVHDISRLARNIEDLHSLVNHITGKGCTVHFIKENLSFTSNQSDPVSQLLLSMLGAVYQFERSIMLERQKEGIEAAKRAGKYTGRKATIDNKRIKQLQQDGYSIAQTAQMMGISKSSVQRGRLMSID